MNSILILGYLGTQTPVHHHLTLARICTAIYFGYFICLPLLNLIDLYFFENNPAKAKEHIGDFKKTLMYYIKIMTNFIKDFINKVFLLIIKFSPSKDTVDYYKVAFRYYFIHGMYIWYFLGLYIQLCIMYATCDVEILESMHADFMNLIKVCSKYLCPFH
jgi:hypothetical protein